MPGVQVSLKANQQSVGVSQAKLQSDLEKIDDNISQFLIRHKQSQEALYRDQLKQNIETAVFRSGDIRKRRASDYKRPDPVNSIAQLPKCMKVGHRTCVSSAMVVRKLRQLEKLNKARICHQRWVHQSSKRKTVLRSQAVCDQIQQELARKEAMKKLSQKQQSSYNSAVEEWLKRDLNAEGFGMQPVIKLPLKKSDTILKDKKHVEIQEYIARKSVSFSSKSPTEHRKASSKKVLPFTPEFYMAVLSGMNRLKQLEEASAMYKATDKKHKPSYPKDQPDSFSEKKSSINGRQSSNLHPETVANQLVITPVTRDESRISNLTKPVAMQEHTGDSSSIQSNASIQKQAQSKYIEILQTLTPKQTSRLVNATVQALNTRYLRIPAKNVETYETLCRSLGAEPGLHSHCNPTISSIWNKEENTESNSSHTIVNEMLGKRVHETHDQDLKGSEFGAVIKHQWRIQNNESYIPDISYKKSPFYQNDGDFSCERRSSSFSRNDLDSSNITKQNFSKAFLRLHKKAMTLSNVKLTEKELARLKKFGEEIKRQQQKKATNNSNKN